MRQNIKQWSKRVVAWQKNHSGITEYVEEVMFDDKSKEKQEIGNTEIAVSSNEDVSKQLKEQLELLKNGRRPQSLITKENQKVVNLNPYHKDRSQSLGCGGHEEKQKADSNSLEEVKKSENELPINKVRIDRASTVDTITPGEFSGTETQFAECSISQTQRDWQKNLESTPEKQITTQENIQPVKQLDTDEKTEKSQTEPSTQQAEKLKTGLNFLDMLMCKVSGIKVNNIKTSPAKLQENIHRVSSSSSTKEVGYEHHHEHSMDSTDEFLGFDDCERIPGMLMTPIVPHSAKKSKNSVFISESLNEYMRLNDLETNYSIDEDKTVTKGKIYARDMEGLMTPKTKPPYFDMPAVPENLLKFRTVAERKQYLQKFSKNYRLAIINNEASIYRELQRRMRTQKVKSASQMLTQSANSSMSFTRNGWKAASFINTEFNKYYYQILDVDHGTHKIRLRGARGNNDDFNKTPYISRVIKPSKSCSVYCADNKVWQYLKPIKIIAEKTKKLNKGGSMSSVFKPCPLSHKTFQKPLDDDTAALLLAGGSMAVVRMPTVELEVFPEYGKPLHEIAKRYLQYILPHHDISREWAEFSVSALQQPKTLKEAEQAAAKSFNSRDLRKSYTFVIPYLNDRNHILVRRVVDRSEKLDESFEQCAEEKELVPKTDFVFRKNLDLTDDVLLTCADVVSDMINTVAISCSENSFIKTDPDGLDNDAVKTNKITEISKKDVLMSSSPNAIVLSGGVVKKQKKQNSLLLELKRLNATIIDAAVKPEKDKKSCCKEYCQMGCICVSLAEVLPIREHCGKTKCMLECSCKQSNQSRIMRLETDGRTLTTEDAFMLRRKATARLARMEKEFTSTVVLTENETLLINETNNDKKRRCTKAPKRYEDFTDTEDEQRRNSPKKTSLTTIDKEKHLATEIKEVYDPVYVEDSILDKLKHCTVNLVPLKDMDNIAPWCMVHNLYKCFCKGRAVEGKPMVIEKEEVNTTFEHNAEQKVGSDCSVTAKAKYSFDKVEKKKNVMNNNNEGDENEICDENVGDDIDEELRYDKGDDDDWIKERKRKPKESREDRAEKTANHSSRGEDSDEAAEDLENSINCTVAQKPKRSLVDVRKRFYLPRPDSCRRLIPTPRRMFLYCNRRRRLNVLKYIKDNENDQTRLLLNEHVMRSVYYHKTDIENNKLNNSASVSNEKHITKDKPNSKVPPLHKFGKILPSAEVTKKGFLLVNEVVDLLEDEDDTSESNKNTDGNSQQVSSMNTKSTSIEKVMPNTDINHFQICSSGGVITVQKCTPVVDLKNNEIRKTTPTTVATTGQKEVGDLVLETDSAVVDLKLPKIASCFSLNAKANIQQPTPTTTGPAEDQCLDFTCATSVHSAAFSQNKNENSKNSPNPLPVETNFLSKDTGAVHILDMDNENVRDVYNNVIKTMNTLVSKKMQDIDCALQRESHIIPTPNSDILCIMKWCNFLDAFSEGFAYIWQVKMKECPFFVVTIQNVMPLIIGAMGVVNIAALKVEKMPLMGKMLLQKFRNSETEKLAVVMQGKQSYWVVKGFLKADPNMACNKPTPESHPSLTKKINVLCSLLVKQRQKEQKKKEKLSSQWCSPQVNPSAATAIPTPESTPPQPLPHAPKVAQIMPTRRIITIQPRGVTQVHNLCSEISPANDQLTSQICQQKDTVTMQKAAINETNSSNVLTKTNSRKRKIDNSQTSLLKMDSYSKMSSNIEFRKVTQSDVDEIFLPELHKLDHKWLVLDLHNDFSHIFVPDFRDLVSLDRIQKVINFARQKSKIVKLQFFQNAPFDAFVTPKSIRKIYFGPLTLNMSAPTLILLQSVDGQMMLRELYQLQHNIVKKPEEKTKAFWLVHLKGQTHFEMDVGVMNEKTSVENMCTNISLTAANKTVIETTTSALVSQANSNNQVEQNVHNDNNDDEDDEDCVIIEDPPTSSHIKKPAYILPKPNLLPDPVSIQTPIPPKNNAGDHPTVGKHKQSLLKGSTTNTTIKPLNAATPVALHVPPMTATNKPLPILTLPPNTVITGINPSTPLASAAPAQIVSLPHAAVITEIQSAPPEASYSSTIFITSSSPEKSVGGTTTTMSNAKIANKTITSSSLENSRKQANELRSTGIKQPHSIIRQALEAGAIKRRRISLFCSNKYDKITENIAVDAVIRKILPDNAEDIQINPLNDKSNVSSIIAPEVSSTVTSMQASKAISSIESKQLQTASESSKATEPTTATSTKAPIVFDVNFMDDGDEPTASIVIKPTSSTTTSSTTTSSSGSKPVVFKATTTSSVPISSPVTSTSVCKSENSTSLINNANISAPPNKKIKLPTLFNTTTTTVTTVANTVITSKRRLINSFLCTKEANVVPKLSAAKPITSKVVKGSCSSFSSLLSPANAVTSTPFTFRSPASLKVQKIVSSNVTSTVQSVKSISTTATVTTNQPSTLTVKQVQDMLNKPGLNVATVNSKTSYPPATEPSSQTLHLLPSIKATLVPTKVPTKAPALLSSPIIITPSSSSATTVSSGCAVSSALITNKPIISTLIQSETTTSGNPALTISKVQSFGSLQKPHNSDKNKQTPISHPPQIIINDPDDKAPMPTPPSHIQYGYIVSSTHANQKFVAKRVADEFYVKVPSVGILKLQGLPAVNNYLNKFMNKILNKTQTTPALWQFVAASKAVQMQNHQKSLLVRQTKSPNSNSETSANKSNCSNNSLEEPILIDD